MDQLPMEIKIDDYEIQLHALLIFIYTLPILLFISAGLARSFSLADVAMMLKNIEDHFNSRLPFWIPS